MTDLTLKENEQWLNGYKAGYAQAQETDLAMPRKEWVGLTHEEHMEIMTGTMTTSSRMAAVEAKLKEKNT
jgi:hypothetical protein